MAGRKRLALRLRFWKDVATSPCPGRGPTDPVGKRDDLVREIIPHEQKKGKAITKGTRNTTVLLRGFCSNLGSLVVHAPGCCQDVIR